MNQPTFPMQIREHNRGLPNQQQQQQQQQTHHIQQPPLTQMPTLQKPVKQSNAILICDASGAKYSAKELANKKPSHQVLL